MSRRKTLEEDEIIMNRNLIKKLILFICFIFLSAPALSVEIPTDDQLLELERLIEQKETEQEKAKQRAVEEARHKAEEQKLKEERARLEQERRLLEAEKQKEDQERQQAEELKRQTEKQQQDEFASHMDTAKTALDNHDRETAISHYEKALSLIPEDTAAKSGLLEAQALKDKVCYDVRGEWLWNDGEAKLILNKDGTLTYIYWGTHSGIWQCSNPAARQIYVKITALGFTQEWNPTLSQDNTCLGLKLALVGPDCLYRSRTNQSDNTDANKKESFQPRL